MATKSPLGLRPRWCANELRMQEILEAMLRYSKAGLYIPREWVEELEQLNETTIFPERNAKQ